VLTAGIAYSAAVPEESRHAPPSIAPRWRPRFRSGAVLAPVAARSAAQDADGDGDTDEDADDAPHAELAAVVWISCLIYNPFAGLVATLVVAR
jgi:hypothetical protein